MFTGRPSWPRPTVNRISVFLCHRDRIWFAACEVNPELPAEIAALVSPIQDRVGLEEGALSVRFPSARRKADSQSAGPRSDGHALDFR